MKYSAPLDGVRAVAILGVFVFHVVPEAMRGGFVGVDVFYVLSGYLITSNVLHDLRAGTFTIREFYVRRVMRLLPNATAMVLATVVLSAALLLPSTAAQAARHGVWTLLNLSNLYILLKLGGYWGMAATSSPLLHTWSLAVEEQFYLVLPACLRVAAPRALFLPALLVATLASFALATAWATSHPDGAFYLLPTRAWQPLVGAVLAAWLVPASPDRPLRVLRAGPLAAAVGWAGLAAVVGSLFLVREGAGFPGWPALPPALGALGVVVAIAAGESGPSRLLGHPVLAWVGRLSYSLYLWHWPLITIGRGWAELEGHAPEVGAVVGAAASVVVAVAAYHGIEKPLRTRGPGRGRRALVLVGGLAACVVACVVTMRLPPGGDASRWFDPTTFRGFAYSSLDARDDPTREGSPRLSDVVRPATPPHDDGLWRRGGVIHRWGDTDPRVVVVGSSHALAIAPAVDDLCKALRLSVAFVAADGVSLFRDGLSTMSPSAGEGIHDAQARWVRAWRPDLVIGADRWDRYLADDARFEARVRALLDGFLPHARRVVLLAQVPALPVGETTNLREHVAHHAAGLDRLPLLPPDDHQPDRDRAVVVLERVARDVAALRVLRADVPFRLPDGNVRYADGRRFFYADDDHLSDAGAAVLSPALEAAIREACGR